jgi:nucleoside-diphosphate-sugar epimerase
MDKVIIYGTYHFLGFSLCEKLLDEGIQVDGYRFNETISEDFLEAKKFLIGRNANFEEKIVGDEEALSSEDSVLSETIIVISFYDMFFSLEENPFPIFEKIVRNISKQYSHHSHIKLICLLPINYIHDLPKSLMEQLNLIKGNQIPLQIIYIPTVVGPWQPSVFLFQQYLLKEYLKIEPKMDKRESTVDAIYIKDVVEIIIHLMDSSEIADCLLQSSGAGQWEKGADYLKLTEINNKNKSIKGSSDSDSIKVIKVKEGTSIVEGLEQQKRHLSRLL